LRRQSDIVPALPAFSASGHNKLSHLWWAFFALKASWKWKWGAFKSHQRKSRLHKAMKSVGKNAKVSNFAQQISAVILRHKLRESFLSVSLVSPSRKLMNVRRRISAVEMPKKSRAATPSFCIFPPRLTFTN